MASKSRFPVVNTVPQGCLGLFVGLIFGGLILVLAARIAGGPERLIGPPKWSLIARVAVYVLPFYAALVVAHWRAKDPAMRMFLRMVLIATPPMTIVCYGLLFALVCFAARGVFYQNG